MLENLLLTKSYCLMVYYIVKLVWKQILIKPKMSNVDNSIVILSFQLSNFN